VASWGYQLRRLDVDEIAASPFDLVVIDYAPDRTQSRELPFTREQVRRMQAKPGGGRRLVIAYLSIGEAERYRTYWQSAWYEPATRPPWLLGVNPQWDGNFLVRYWHPDWKRIIFGRPESYLGRIMAAGFDGVYLDRADAFQELAGKHPEAEREMVRFIGEIAAYARSVRPELLIVLQNAEELVAHASVRQTIDAIAKEDLIYGVNHDGKRNPAGMIAASLADLRRARKAGLKVLAVEYLEPGEKAAKAAAEARREGIVLHFAERSLGRLTLPAQPRATSPTGR
jgi:cysteinyl-tRNA synthetase